MKGKVKTTACASDLLFALINSDLPLDLGDVLTTKKYPGIQGCQNKLFKMFLG